MWTKETIQNLLMTNDRAVERALLVLFERQTSTEQLRGDTIVHNNQGFCSSDAGYMTDWAKEIAAGGHLTPRQLAFLRQKNRITKYHRQLLEAARAKMERQIAQAAA